MKALLKNKIILSSLIAIIFFIVQLITIKDYNIMWDARNHFFRGQAFANFFLFGRHNYEDLPVNRDFLRYYRDYSGMSTSPISLGNSLSSDKNYRRSVYQDNAGTFDWLMSQKPTGHPTISDTLSSFFNIIFYEKLGVLRDDHAYALYSVVLASVLVGAIFFWISTRYNFFTAFVSTIVLITTPLFLAESHYNIKDIPLLVFFSLATIYGKS